MKRVPNHGRNAFDLSHRHLFTANFGELLPSTCIEVVPGDYLELSVSDLLRAAPMVTSPFLRAKQHLDVYYVPYNSLWSRFEEFMTGKSEPKRSVELSQGFIPHVNLYDLHRISTIDPDEDIVGLPYFNGSARILDLLGYGRQDLSGTVETHPSVNIWRLAAYNKIWYEHYRQQYYDDGTFMLSHDVSNWKLGRLNPAVLFNFDDVLSNSEVTSDIYNDGGTLALTKQGNLSRIQAMCQMRYRLWKKDLFTGVLPDTQFGSVSAVYGNAVGELVDEFYLKAENFDSQNHFLESRNNSGFVGIRPSASTDVPLSSSFTAREDESLTSDKLGLVAGGTQSKLFDILDLRKAEAVQIWREAALTAGNRIKDNLQAHYGSDADYLEQESVLLGSVSSSFNISDVNSTSQTGEELNGALGDVAGKGISTFDGNVIKFKAKHFGVVMCIFSILPEAEYQSTGIDRMNQLLEQEDYFVPEYQDLGLEPISSLDFIICLWKLRVY